MPRERKSPDPRGPMWPESAQGATSTGTLVGERYRLETALGRGGMGVVFAAVHVHTQRRVALKLIHCAWDHDRLALYRRFLGEARAASAVRHRNVVDVLDMGHHHGAPYLVMERLAGESLERVLERVPVLPLDAVLAWLLPVMGALAVLHEAGIVHRDIKPSNIFLARDPPHPVVPKLLDFGLAQTTWEAPLTEPGVMLGTPEYMAPERARGQRVGPSADVWAMGVVLFECLCGRTPFTATSLNGIAAQVVAGEVLKTEDANPLVPAPVAAVIDRALAPAPADRPRDMAQLAYDLAHAAYLSGATLPNDPDPVGLPAFGVLSVKRDAWVSGPQAAPTERILRPSSFRPLDPQGWLRGAALSALALLLMSGGALGWRWTQVGETAREGPPSLPSPPQLIPREVRRSAPPGMSPGAPAPSFERKPIVLGAPPPPSPRSLPREAAASDLHRPRPGGRWEPSRQALPRAERTRNVPRASAARDAFEKEWL